jgi:hypothetical protein
MFARNFSPFVSPSSSAMWRRWEAGSIQAFAHMATIRWPNAADFGGRPLPQLRAIISGLSCYHSLHASCRGLSAAARRELLNHVVEGVDDAAADLRRYDLDLYWRIGAQDADEGGTAPPANSLAAPLAIERLR